MDTIIVLIVSHYSFILYNNSTSLGSGCSSFQLAAVQTAEQWALTCKYNHLTKSYDFIYTSIVPTIVSLSPPPPPSLLSSSLHFFFSSLLPPPPSLLSSSLHLSFSLLRSPSPEPIYTSDGKRFNTREVRVRKRLEDERHDHIQAALLINPDYKPPMDYK